MTDTNKRLLYVTESVYPDRTDTIPVYVYHLAKRAVQAGYQVTVVTAQLTDAPLEEVIEGFTVRRFPVETDGRINYYLSCIKGADKLVREIQKQDNPFDLVHFFHHIPALGARLGGKLKRFNNKLFSHFSSLSSEYSIKGLGKDRGAGYRAETGLHIEGSIFPLLMDNIEAKNFAKCKYITALTHHAKLRILEEKVRKDKVYLLPPGTDLDQYRIGKTSERKSMHGDAEKVFTFLGYMTPVNATNVFIDIAAQLRKIYPKARFVVIGDGDQKEHVKQQVSSLMMNDSFEWYSQDENTPKRLRTSDWLIWPSLDDRLPLVFFDAFASGVPVAAFDTGGHTEFLNDGDTAVLAPVNDIIAMVSKIVAFDEKRPNDLSKRLRARVQEFAWQSVFENVNEIYGNILQ